MHKSLPSHSTQPPDISSRLIRSYVLGLLSTSHYTISSCSSVSRIMNLITQPLEDLRLDASSGTTASTLGIFGGHLNPTNTALSLVDNRLQPTSQVQPFQPRNINHQLVPTAEPVIWTGKYSAFYTGQTPEGYVA